MTLEEREICVECCDALTFQDVHYPVGQNMNSLVFSLGTLLASFFLNCLIKKLFLDRGGLHKASKDFTEWLCSIYKFLENVLPKLMNTNKVLHDLVGFLVPYVTACSTFTCIRVRSLPESQKHNERMVATCWVIDTVKHSSPLSLKLDALSQIACRLEHAEKGILLVPREKLCLKLFYYNHISCFPWLFLIGYPW